MAGVLGLVPAIGFGGSLDASPSGFAPLGRFAPVEGKRSDFLWA